MASSDTIQAYIARSPLKYQTWIVHPKLRAITKSVMQYDLDIIEWLSSLPADIRTWYLGYVRCHGVPLGGTPQVQSSKTLEITPSVSLPSVLPAKKSIASPIRFSSDTSKGRGRFWCLTLSGVDLTTIKEHVTPLYESCSHYTVKVCTCNSTMLDGIHCHVLLQYPTETYLLTKISRLRLPSNTITQILKKSEASHLQQFLAELPAVIAVTKTEISLLPMSPPMSSPVMKAKTKTISPAPVRETILKVTSPDVKGESKAVSPSIHHLVTPLSQLKELELKEKVLTLKYQSLEEKVETCTADLNEAEQDFLDLRTSPFGDPSIATLRAAEGEVQQAQEELDRQTHNLTVLQEERDEIIFQIEVIKDQLGLDDPV